MEETDTTKIKHSDKLIKTIRKASGRMSFDEYAKVTGIDKEVIFRILKGEVEKIDKDTWDRLSLKN